MTEDDARFEELYDAYADRILNYALRRTSPDLAHDVVSDTFLVLWRRLHDAPEDPLPWLYGTARKVLANHRRSQVRQESIRVAMAAETEVPTDAGDPAGVVDGNEDVDDVVKALRRVAAGDQEVLCLVAWEDLDTTRGARALGCSPTAFKVRLHRARRRLAQQLEAVRNEARREEPQGTHVQARGSGPGIELAKEAG